MPSLPTPDALQLALTLSTLAGIWLAWAKFIGPRVKSAWAWFSDLFAVFNGRKERIDRVTGEKRKAVPSLVDALVQIRDKQDEQGNDIKELTTVVTQVADQQLTLSEHTRQIADLRVGFGVHAEQIGMLKAAAEERTAIHNENATFFDAVAKRSSDVIDPQGTP